jgi:hypothetical protein
VCSRDSSFGAPTTRHVQGASSCWCPQNSSAWHPIGLVPVEDIDIKAKKWRVHERKEANQQKVKRFWQRPINPGRSGPAYKIESRIRDQGNTV